jgi:hypothetical protein
MAAPRTGTVFMAATIFIAEIREERACDFAEERHFRKLTSLLRYYLPVGKISTAQPAVN